MKNESLRTTGDLLRIWETAPPQFLPMLKSTIALLGTYLETVPDAISLDLIAQSRAGFRRFLEGRRYAAASVRTYVGLVRILLNLAEELGWILDETVPAEWTDLLAPSTAEDCEDVLRHFVGLGKQPADITLDDVDQWVASAVQTGMPYTSARSKRTGFWRVLTSGSATSVSLPPTLLRKERYGVAMEELPAKLRTDLAELLRWKQAAFAIERPRDAKYRPVTATILRQFVCGMYGFAIKTAPNVTIESLADLVQKPIVGAFIEWLLNEREMKPDGVHSRLRLLSAAMRQHPSYKTINVDWLVSMLASIPRETRAAINERKARKYLELEALAEIPSMIHATRAAALKKGGVDLAHTAMQELLMQWLVTIPWRQRNIRECRIAGAMPNLFKAKISPFSDIQKPDWVIKQERNDPDATFWQFRFSEEETKTGAPVHSILPRRLVAPLEEYLSEFRPALVRDSDPGTLFLNRVGQPMDKCTMTLLVSELTLRYGGRRVTPHRFRDIVAFAWLREHAHDYLTLSKLLWHADVNTTLKIYGSRFNESSAICAMESWLEQRTQADRAHYASA